MEFFRKVPLQKTGWTGPGLVPVLYITMEEGEDGFKYYDWVNIFCYIGTACVFEFELRR